jgi:hypothetical protein
LNTITRDNSFDCSLNRLEITVLLSYIHAHSHKSTVDDNVSISYHYKIGADRFEDVSDEDIKLLLKKRDSNITKHVIKGAVRILFK